MATEAGILPAMSVHPFFTRPKATAQSKSNDDEDSAVHPPQDASDEPYDEQERFQRKTSRETKKKDDQAPGRAKTQRTLGEIVNPKAPDRTQQDDVIDLCTSEPDSNSGRRKRQRTSDYDSLDVGSESHIKNEELNHSERRSYHRDSSPQVIIPASSPLPLVQPVGDEVVAGDSAIIAPKTPTKVLRLNANGKFSSPPSKKPRDQVDPKPEAEPPKRRVRPRRSAKPGKEFRLLVKCLYGTNESERQILGERIDRILLGEETVHVTNQVLRKKGNSTSRRKTPQKPSRALHPFFGGKPKEQLATLQVKPSPRKPSAVTPGKLRMQTLSDQLHDAKEVPFSSALLKDRLMTKHPGSRDPPFPAKEQVHVRGLQPEDGLQRHGFDLPSTTMMRRKRKRANIPVPPSESLIAQFAAQLTPEEDTGLRDDGFQEPDRSLHIPDRLLLPGQEIAKQIAGELSIAICDSDDDELSYSGDIHPHAALRDLFDRIPATLTAYDDCKGETLPWAQKYAPLSSGVVLQPESEMKVLRDWLKSLAVQSVVGAVAIPGKPANAKATDKAKKKRKKKAEGLDDFIVDSDDECRDMGELPEGGDPTTTKTAQRSIVQIAHDGAKLSNAVLLSGPHGCGKTAAAYAVAKELGFKVFEISSSERRSGRDILEKVGDMTENHLVKHHGREDATAALSSSEENGQLDDAFQKDLVSGKQGKMNAFFKPQGISKEPQPKKILKEKKTREVQEALKKPSRDQQQSLILLEEVDILFKEDKDFWTTVLRLITTSKRPFIMTCNDEDLVPTQAMRLHAILRFSPPPVELATDYMLLVAAAEGHLLKRQAVASLYEHHAHDLRASISKLDYWCQMGIGDPRGGLTWIYQRWPPGSDVDGQGRKLRTVSNGTFQDGMGTSSIFADAEDALSWLEHDFCLDASTALGWNDMQGTAQPTVDLDGDASEHRQILARYADFADALSAADLCTANNLAGIALLDTTQPELPEKARAHYIEGMALLQTDEAIEYSAMSERLLHCQFVAASRLYSAFGLQERLSSKSIATLKSHQGEDVPLSRSAFACFDAIATSSEVSVSHPGLQQSAFDGTFRTIALDLAPYVRSIVQYDQALMEQRERLGLLIGDGDGRRAKRSRTTRAARSALEGGQRASTRRERWFDKPLNMDAVMATGGMDWPRSVSCPASVDEASKDPAESPTPSAGDDEIKYE